MTIKRYQFRFHGLEEPSGEIKASDLARALDALAKAAESATVLLATGEGRRRRGPKPAWLTAATQFRVTGLTSGSTVLTIDTDRLVDAPNSPFGQRELWPDRIEVDPDDTALDVAARAIREVQVEDSPGDGFDDAVLDAILDLGKSVRCTDVAYSLEEAGASDTGFVLERRACKRIAERKRSIPEPKALIVSGRLEQIAHTSGQFLLEPHDGQRLYGRLHADADDVEVLRPLWGRHATVQGIVHFKANGQPRLIEAHRVSAWKAGDYVFEAIPSTSHIAAAKRPPPAIPSKDAKPIDLVGTWPGDEPIEELLEALRSDVQ